MKTIKINNKNKQQINNLKKSLDEAHKSIDNLNRAYDKLQNEINAKQNGYEIKINELIKSINDLKEKDKNNTDCDKLQLQNHNDALKASATIYKNALKHSLKEIGDLNEENGLR